MEIRIIKIQVVGIEEKRYYLVYAFINKKGLWEEKSLRITEEEARNLRDKKEYDALVFLEDKLRELRKKV